MALPTFRVVLPISVNLVEELPWTCLEICLVGDSRFCQVDDQYQSSLVLYEGCQLHWLTPQQPSLVGVTWISQTRLWVQQGPGKLEFAFLGAVWGAGYFDIFCSHHGPMLE